MSRALAIVAALGVAACNQREEQKPRTPSPAPAPAAVAAAQPKPSPEIVAPPDAAAVAAAPPDAAPPDARGRAHAAHDDAVALQEEAARYADLLTADDPGPTEGDMDRHRPGADLDQQIADVKEGGKAVSIGGGAGRGPSLASGDPSPAPHLSTRVVVTGKAALDDTSLTVDRALAKVQSAYLAGIKRCYQDDLATDAAAHGTVTLAFTVDETGRVTDAGATAFDAAIKACLAERMSGWRFPIPKSADGEPTAARFTIELRLSVD